jgi:hypothetical protein
VAVVAVVAVATAETFLQVTLVAAALVVALRQVTVAMEKGLQQQSQ